MAFSIHAILADAMHQRVQTAGLSWPLENPERGVAPR